ncbi:hypothetical protein [Sphingobacterium spiritivorum]|uniref:hypothetical protein n=1 Tax=Sphingobacterium spiritivorum TaxID=258 RepID=UPI001917ED8C|nr:hypothetical protein [Sphingobacterium spiritivorum]QQT25228.1 hypothetical protein I6J02_16075 [Sphingobacterium spiritivorum]
MNKYLKGCLIVFGVILLIIMLIIAWIWWSLENRQKDAERDRVEVSEMCDTVKVITEQPTLGFIKFEPNELKTLKFEILRDGKFIDERTIRTDFTKKNDDIFWKVNIPYKHFFKTDTIVLTTTNNLKYYISDYHHYAYLQYGMFGYLGSHDCRFSEDCKINNRVSSGIIDRMDGWVDVEKAKQISYIDPSTDEFNAFSRSLPVKNRDAENIFQDNRENKTLYSMYSYGIEVTPNGSYYVFAEELENRRGHMDVIKINTKTGAYKRYKNYPFEN